LKLAIRETKRESPKEEMIDGKELECWVVGVIV
jgi:hypothetical protein